MAKYNQLSEQLKNRISQGDYAIHGLPPERQLARESGVSYLTARRALQQLIDEGILLRGSNGRAEVKRDRSGEGAGLQIAFLAPAFPSPNIEWWRNQIIQASESVNCVVRPILFTHWDDPQIASTLESFDGVFLLPTSEPIPAQQLKRLKETKCCLVALEEDLTPFGVPTVRQSSPVFVQRLLDHLEERGFRTIDCLNVQPHDSTVEQRIAQWRYWMAAHHFDGQLFNEPVEAYNDPFSHGYTVAKRLLSEGHLKNDALLCITVAAAIGANRAMQDVGIRPGIDIALCAVGGESLAALQVPSITALEAPDVSPFINLCLNWMANGSGAWSGPLLMQPEALLVVRESTAPSNLIEQM